MVLLDLTKDGKLFTSDEEKVKVIKDSNKLSIQQLNLAVQKEQSIFDIEPNEKELNDDAHPLELKTTGEDPQEAVNSEADSIGKENEAYYRKKCQDYESGKIFNRVSYFNLNENIHYCILSNSH